MGLLTIGGGIFKPGQRTFNRTRLDVLILQQNKTFWRKAEDCTFLKTNKRAKRGAVGVIESGKCLPLIALVMRLKTLGKIDLDQIGKANAAQSAAPKKTEAKETETAAVSPAPVNNAPKKEEKPVETAPVVEKTQKSDVESVAKQPEVKAENKSEKVEVKPVNKPEANASAISTGSSWRLGSRYFSAPKPTPC